MASYYVADGGQQRGPFTIDQLKAMGLRPETLVWCEGMDQWRRADLVAELQRAGVIGPAGGGQPAPSPGPVGYDTRPIDNYDSSRVAAGVCGILLGALGIHKFITGRSGAGMTMLLLSICTCGIAAGIMHIIGIIEGIMYLSMPDAQFHQIYIVQKKNWF